MYSLGSFSQPILVWGVLSPSTSTSWQASTIFAGKEDFFFDIFMLVVALAADASSLVSSLWSWATNVFSANERPYKKKNIWMLYYLTLLNPPDIFFNILFWGGGGGGVRSFATTRLKLACQRFNANHKIATPQIQFMILYYYILKLVYWNYDILISTQLRIAK